MCLHRYYVLIQSFLARWQATSNKTSNFQSYSFYTLSNNVFTFLINTTYNIIFHNSNHRHLHSWRFAAEIVAIRRLYIGLRVRYKYCRKNSRIGLAWSRPYADRGLSRPTSVFRTIPCVQNFIQVGWDLAVRGPKTCFWVKTENGQAYT